MTRSPARNSCLNKCSLISRPPIHEQIYNQEDFGLSHRHLSNDEDHEDEDDIIDEDNYDDDYDDHGDINDDDNDAG